MSAIIENNQVLHITRYTGYKRCPKITVDQIIAHTTLEELENGSLTSQLS
jgi:hypothetical protein